MENVFINFIIINIVHVQSFSVEHLLIASCNNEVNSHILCSIPFQSTVTVTIQCMRVSQLYCYAIRITVYCIKHSIYLYKPRGKGRVGGVGGWKGWLVLEHTHVLTMPAARRDKRPIFWPGPLDQSQARPPGPCPNPPESLVCDTMFTPTHNLLHGVIICRWYHRQVMRHYTIKPEMQ